MREAANRAEATAFLIRAGYRVYRPEADCYGEDLVVRAPNGELRAVQLKGRPTVDLVRYGRGKKIWMLFPDPRAASTQGRTWFLIPHGELYRWVKRRHPTFNDVWSYPVISRAFRSFLEPFSHHRW
jgi:predicted S18 family serine protease